MSTSGKKRLSLLVGLPGSGKRALAQLMEREGKGEFKELNIGTCKSFPGDFIAELSRHRSYVIASSDFCDSTVLSKFKDVANRKWYGGDKDVVYFRKDEDTCERNIRFRNQSVYANLVLLRRLADVYSPPGDVVQHRIMQEWLPEFSLDAQQKAATLFQSRIDGRHEFEWKLLLAVWGAPVVAATGILSSNQQISIDIAVLLPAVIGLVLYVALTCHIIHLIEAAHLNDRRRLFSIIHRWECVSPIEETDVKRASDGWIAFKVTITFLAAGFLLGVLISIWGNEPQSGSSTTQISPEAGVELGN